MSNTRSSEGGIDHALDVDHVALAVLIDVAGGTTGDPDGLIDALLDIRDRNAAAVEVAGIGGGGWCKAGGGVERSSAPQVSTFKTELRRDFVGVAGTVGRSTRDVGADGRPDTLGTFLTISRRTRAP